MKTAIMLIAAILAAGAPARADDSKEAVKAAGASASRSEALRALDSGVTAGDPQMILMARADLSAMLAKQPDDADLLYWTAVADWRAVPLMQAKNKEASKRQCDAGLDAIEKTIALAPASAEAIALRAALQGLSLAFKDPGAAMTLGPEMSMALEKAVKMAPDNPRVLLLDAINTYHMPAFVGGGADKAEAKLQKARTAFEAEEATPEHWGREDVYIWLGRTAMAREDWAAAESWLRRALELKPGHAWVGRSLLPKVEAERAKQGG